MSSDRSANNTKTLRCNPVKWSLSFQRLHREHQEKHKAFNVATHAIRRVVSRARPALQDASIETVACPYSLTRKLWDSEVQYNKKLLIHTVRDRFTPKYAHLHKRKELAE
jgi:hypothetical protein